MPIPYIGFGNEKLAKLPKAYKGMLIECHKCGKDHPLKCGKEDGKETEMIMFFECKGKLFLGGLAGKLVKNIKPSCSGKI